ncbi:MAG TPA: tRNA (N(6)-L-threonylcarbamoyladenosine(37)-C(2))-methylthiotransferase MtaB [Candidatus Kapabacteria bacterium]|nr:tRNA (N(6)-L-threonylcarbamoyladenosine(37)-C(2))-methylthiotransferase MtaB [Candidatus Kapabacteria bacterium]
MKTVTVHTLGCKVNYSETAQLVDKFEELGYTIKEFGEQSDIILINTCSVTNNADVEARKIIRRAKRKSPNAFLGVLGCYAQLKPDEVAQIEGVDGVFGQREKFMIPSLIHQYMNGDMTQINVSCIEDLPFEPAVTTDSESRTRAFLKLQDGCNYFCSFCTIPNARGRSRSIDIAHIPRQLEKVVNAGYKEVVISGINLGDYKSKNGENFIDLVKLISQSEQNLRVRISSVEPNLVKDEIIDIVHSSDKFCKHFHIPLQSGSKEILRKMKRRYRPEQYKELVYKIKDKIPNCGIGVDVIVGFPGETDEYFIETFDLLNELPISYLHVFTYSERDNTPAIKFPNPVKIEERKRRTNILRDLSFAKKQEFYAQQIGKLLTVIPESFNESEGQWKSWSDNYVRVKFPADKSLKKDFTKILITSSDDEFAYGTIFK